MRPSINSDSRSASFTALVALVVSNISSFSEVQSRTGVANVEAASGSRTAPETRGGFGAI